LIVLVQEIELSRATMLFLMSVVPSIAIVVILAMDYWIGGNSARNIRNVALILATIWLGAALWGLVDLGRRRKGRRK